MDRLGQHTQHCTSCRLWLHSLQRAEAGSAAAAAALALVAAGGVHTPLLAGGAGLAALLALAARHLQRELIFKPYVHH